MKWLSERQKTQWDKEKTRTDSVVTFSASHGVEKVELIII
jgi:hypothetical protein